MNQNAMVLQKRMLMSLDPKTDKPEIPVDPKPLKDQPEVPADPKPFQNQREIKKDPVSRDPNHEIENPTSRETPEIPKIPPKKNK